MCVWHFKGCSESLYSTVTTFYYGDVVNHHFTECSVPRPSREPDQSCREGDRSVDVVVCFYFFAHFYVVMGATTRTYLLHVPVESKTGPWCSSWDLNPDCDDFESTASSCWARRTKVRESSHQHYIGDIVGKFSSAVPVGLCSYTLILANLVYVKFTPKSLIMDLVS